MDMRIPPLEIKTLLESDPPKSRILAGRLAASPDIQALRRQLSAEGVRAVAAHLVSEEIIIMIMIMIIIVVIAIVIVLVILIYE